jgi:hypothetical protein
MNDSDEVVIVPDAPQRQISPEAAAHPLGIWLWLLPVIAIAVVPLGVVLFEGINSLRMAAAMSDSAWNLANTAIGIISGLLIGVGATAAVSAVKK